MEIQKTKIEGVLLIKPAVFADERGYFFESYRADKYAEIGIPLFVQDNESRSKKDVLRGLHFQTTPYAQGKLVRVVQGKVLDVAVDLRPDSATFGQHVMYELSDENNLQLWIPSGFAHGFLTLSEYAILSYKCTTPYHKASEQGILWNDPDLAIDWPIVHPLLSEKDKLLSHFRELFPSS